MTLILQHERIKRVFKIFRVLSIISAVGSALFLLLILMVFGPIIFIKQNLTVEAGGLIGFFLDVVKEGENPITSADLIMSVMPRTVQLLFFFIFSLRAASALKKGESDGTLGFFGAKKAFTSLSVLSFLIALLSSVLTRVAQNSVSKDFFNITETSYAGWVVLGLVLLFVALTVEERKNQTEQNAEERQEEQ